MDKNYNLITDDNNHISDFGKESEVLLNELEEQISKLEKYSDKFQKYVKDDNFIETVHSLKNKSK